jgi:hypothetical protein
LALFHHAPDRTDDEIDDIVRTARMDAPSPLTVLAASEGMSVHLTPSRASTTDITLGQH